MHSCDEEDEELAHYEAFLADEDKRMLAPPNKGEPSARLKLGRCGDVQIWEAYLSASAILIRECMTCERKASTLIYPALFNLRHAIEIALKYHIKYIGGEIPKGGVHNIELLARILENCAGEQPEEMTGRMTYMLPAIIEMSSIDPKSLTFRYARNVDGSPMHMEDINIGLRRLLYNIDEIDTYFYELSGAIELTCNDEYIEYLRS